MTGRSSSILTERSTYDDSGYPIPFVLSCRRPLEEVRMLQTSRYLMNGSLKVCAYNDCKGLLTGSVFRGKSGAYYCTARSREWAFDEATVEEAARQVH
jgi:hypothetical protein